MNPEDIVRLIQALMAQGGGEPLGQAALPPRRQHRSPSPFGAGVSVPTTGRLGGGVSMQAPGSMGGPASAPSPASSLGVGRGLGGGIGQLGPSQIRGDARTGGGESLPGVRLSGQGLPGLPVDSVHAGGVGPGPRVAGGADVIGVPRIGGRR